MFKQVIIVRKDIKMDKGKIAAQVAHASIEAYKKSDAKEKAGWESEGSKKVILKVDDLKGLMSIYERVRKKFPCSLIRDAGRTQIEPGTITVLGIGPCEEKEIDKITKHLKLL
ncbi:MAG: peptidyl-tRNA hydrolase [Candidatus Aenigmarchaeota archaeon]|nr:peptidyl-tRNA hydrolase [Candidatus Aenigmarchaeota archaeon]